MKKIIAIFISLAALLSGCAVGRDTPAPRDDTLVIAITRDENTLTPYTYVTGTPGLEVMRLVYDSLFTFGIDGGVIPWMVDSYTICAHSRVYTMTLSAGQYWHDGTALTAGDVEFTFEYALTQNRSRWRAIAGQVESIETDGREITITLTDGNPDFLRSGLADMPIIPRHVFENVEDASLFDGPTIGSSLFRLTQYRIGQYYVFEAVEGYFRGEAAVSRINMPIITDPAAVSQALIAGQIAAATRSVPFETLDAFSDADGIEIMSGRGYSPTMLLFNCHRGLLSDPLFRRAIIHAMDIDAMMNTVTLGRATLGSPGFSDMPDVVYLHNSVAAAMIFDQLGLTVRDSDGLRLHDGEPVTFSLLVQSASPNRIRAAELISAYLREVGIGVTVVAMESDTVDAHVWPGFDVSQGHQRDFDMTMWGWSAATRLDPAFIVRLGASDHAVGDLNLGGFVNARFDELSRAYLDTTDAQTRAEFSEAMQQVFAQYAPFVNLWYEDLHFAVNTDDFDGWVFQMGVGVVNRFSFLV